jgi:hypothetical protein
VRRLGFDCAAVIGRCWTANWIARQITEAFRWDQAPRYVIRDRDCVYGAAVTHRLRTMGIRDKPIAAVAERLRPKADWIDPTRVRRPFGCFRRSALTPDSDEICCLL